AATLYQHSFPTRRSSDLDAVSRTDTELPLRGQPGGGREPRGALHAGRFVREERHQPGGLPDGRAHPRAAPPGPPHRGAPASPLEAARRCAFLRTPGISGGLGRRASVARRPTSGLTSAASCEPHDALPRNNSLAVYSWTVTSRQRTQSRSRPCRWSDETSGPGCRGAHEGGFTLLLAGHRKCPARLSKTKTPLVL